MESNGKSVDLDGDRSDYDTGPIVWGEPARTASTPLPADPPGHALIPCDFIGFLPGQPARRHHDLLMANLFAQTEALAFGKTRARSRPRASRRQVPHRVVRRQPADDTLLARRCTPRVLGS
jgi:glucose-6-phosphate isomerase